MKFYTYKKIKLKNNLPRQNFQFFLRLWNLYQMIFKCSLVQYVMIMLMAMIFLG